MIKRYTDHAANERTFLAWVRTAVAVMALGFLVEKFDLFLRTAAASFGGHPPSAASQVAGSVAGLLLILLGGAMIAVATLRFRQTARQIDREGEAVAGTRTEVTLVLLLLGLGGTLFVFLFYTALRGS